MSTGKKTDDSEPCGVACRLMLRRKETTSSRSIVDVCVLTRHLSKRPSHGFDSSMRGGRSGSPPNLQYGHVPCCIVAELIRVLANLFSLSWILWPSVSLETAERDLSRSSPSRPGRKSVVFAFVTPILFRVCIVPLWTQSSFLSLRTRIPPCPRATLCSIARRESTLDP